MAKNKDGPKWVICCDETYYPWIEEYDSEDDARHALRHYNPKPRTEYGPHIYLCEVKERYDR